MMNLFVWVCIIKGLTISVSLLYVSGSQTLDMYKNNPMPSLKMKIPGCYPPQFHL